MNGSEHLRQTLDYYRQQLQRKMEELRPLQVMIRQLELELGEAHEENEQDEPTALFRFSIPPDSLTPPQSGRSDVRPDEFFGMSQTEAAKAYLKKIGRAVSLDDIVTALNKGGARVGGVNPKKTLYVSLMRNPMREFVSPSENHIGLRAFYPGLPKTEKAKTGKAKGKKKRPAKKARAVEAAKDDSGGAKVPGPKGHVKKVLVAALSGGESRSGADLAEIVVAKLGVPKVAVFGALRGREFAQVDGKYRLAQ